jgi:nickel-dependent lactate racemase
VTQLRLRTAAWYGDGELDLPVPVTWKVDVFSPLAGQPLTDAQIAERIAAPLGQPRLRELAQGKVRPVLIVDDLNRSTPAHRVVPAVLRELATAGIAPESVTIVMAPGTHGAPPPDAMSKKVGTEVARVCRVHVHDCHGPLVRVGRTRFGTPVMVNRQVAESDLVVGIGGIAPNQTAGFGGGSKLALGVLGFRSIAGLHFGHQAAGWGTPSEGLDFRRDLDEIAHLIRLRSVVSVLIDGNRDVVDVRCGDPDVYYRDFLAMAMELGRAPSPGASFDVVIANTYPNDQSLTFARMKGFAPLRRAPAASSKIAIAACPEGLGFHGLFPFQNPPAHHARRMRALQLRILVRNPRLLFDKVRHRAMRRTTAVSGGGTVWLFRPAPAGAASLPAGVPGITITRSWSDVLGAVSREQGGRDDLRAAVYSTASLQWLA